MTTTDTKKYQIKRLPVSEDCLTWEQMQAEDDARKQAREARATRGVVLHARIREDSKYFGQTAPGDLFKVYVKDDFGLYILGGGPGGQYRLRDVDLFAEVAPGRFIQISALVEAGV